jgi:hypothetical protein
MMTGSWNTVGNMLCQFQKIELAHAEQAAIRFLEDPPRTFLQKYDPWIRSSVLAMPQSEQSLNMPHLARLVADTSRRLESRPARGA